MNKLEADLDAKREESEARLAKRKAQVIADPVELFQALAPTGMSLNSEEKKFYSLLGWLAKQGLDTNRLEYCEMEHIADIVKELSEYIENAVEDYLEENSDG